MYVYPKVLKVAKDWLLVRMGAAGSGGVGWALACTLGLPRVHRGLCHRARVGRNGGGRLYVICCHCILVQNSNSNLAFKVDMKAILSLQEVRLYFI